MYFMAVVERGTGKYSNSNTLWFGFSFLLLLFFIEQVMHQLWHSGLVQMFKIMFWLIANTPVVYYICNVFYLLFCTRKQSFIVLKLIKQPTYNFISHKKDYFENQLFTSLSGLIYNVLLHYQKLHNPAQSMYTTELKVTAIGQCYFIC